MSIEFLITLVGVAGAIAAAVIADRRAAKKSVVADLAVLVAALQKENERQATRLEEAEAKIENYESEIETLRLEVDNLSAGIGILIEQIIKLGHRPKWQPTRRGTGTLNPSKALEEKL